MATVAPDTALGRGPVLWRRSGDQILIRRRGQDRLVVLAGTGVALWSALQTPVTFAELVTELATAHDAPVERVSDDLQVTVANLLDDGVVVMR